MTNEGAHALYAEGDVPGVDRPWRYNDIYYWGDIAMRVTDPEMMNLPPIRGLGASFVDIKDVDA